MQPPIKIGTRQSELAVWQATLVQNLLAENGHASELVFIKTEGDIDLQTPLYEMGVQGIFTRGLDMALLNNQVDIAVHSLKDVPTQLPVGLATAAVLKRGNYNDLFVINENNNQWAIDNEQLTTENIPETDSPIHHSPFTIDDSPVTIASSSIRRKAQWLHRYPHHRFENLRGNINTRLQKVKDSNWAGAIFAAAGLERINLKPSSAIELNWMLPAPAQGAIVIMCRDENIFLKKTLDPLHDINTGLCTKLERDFLRGLLGGCSTPISALALIDKNEIYFKGNIVSPDGKEKIEIERYVKIENAGIAGLALAQDLLANGGKEIADKMKRDA